jgi:endonuclease
LTAPDADAAVTLLKSALGHRLVIVIARCRIHYSGRAESTLPSGERLLVFKPDGTLLVHTQEKLKPVNWQPPGCAFQAGVAAACVVITATREKPKEIVRLDLEDVLSVQAVDLSDDGDLDLVGTEDDLQALLAKRPELIEPGFQFWVRERASGRGPVDLYGVDAKGRRVLVETKRRNAAVADVEQLRRYVERERKARGDVIVRGILVAPQVSETAKRYLNELDLECREIDWGKLQGTAKAVRRAGQTSLGKFDQ